MPILGKHCFICLKVVILTCFHNNNLFNSMLLDITTILKSPSHWNLRVYNSSNYILSAHLFSKVLIEVFGMKLQGKNLKHLELNINELICLPSGQSNYFLPGPHPSLSQHLHLHKSNLVTQKPKELKTFRCFSLVNGVHVQPVQHARQSL